MSELTNAIRTEFRNLQLHEVLHKSPKALLGITAAAQEALGKLEINTVFDLATSAVFEGATRIVSAGTDLRSALAQHGAPTADLVREAETVGKKIDELQFLPISVLESIPAGVVDEVATALDAQTVRDPALYPPFRAAHELLDTLYFPENAPDFDPERPPDLVPRTGEYPTERVQYTTLLMDAIQGPDGRALTDVTSPSFTPLNLAALAAGDSGFKTVAFGALLTFNQSWYAQGVTLGQLLHSAALAPGESTRVAVVDWSRRSRAGETEVIDEQDDLTNDATHNRSISEVTRAVATEAQSGFSHASTSSTSQQRGTAVAAELSAPLGGLFGGPSGSMGHTSSSASGSSTADGYSSSFGQRNVASSMMQNVNDRTHQHAHSSRSRRASVVKEVSQTEHENVSTRVLANYNHMHALTIQYYEVVQIHRVEVSLSKAEKVVFIPVALVDFDDDTMIRRFQHVLARAALTYDAREALTNLDVIEIAPDKRTRFAVLEAGIGDFLRSALTASPAITDIRAAVLKSDATPPAALAAGTTAAAGVAVTGVQPSSLSLAQQIATGAGMRASAANALPLVQRVNDGLWTSAQAARLSSLLNRSILRRDSTSIFLPTDVSVEGVVVSAGGAPITVTFHLRGGGADTSVSASDPLAMTDVVRIGLSGSAPDRDVSATVTLTVNRNGVRFPLELPTVTISKGEAGETRLVTVDPGGVSANLKQHLKANRLQYSQAVLRSLDSAQMALLLAGFGIKVGDETVPVAQVVEPRPIRYVGNYLAFKLNVDAESDRTWAAWLEDHGIVVGGSQQDIVPLGTGGTFAEAVLGRSNSAEKLDVTRFWDWQDSPIPLQPTEIAAIQTGSRATPEDTKPGQLSAPIVNITSPTSLPDPAGTAAVLAAIQNGSMFRDMSGLQGTIGLAQAALQSTAAGASTAGQQAGTNMENLLKANTERQRIAAEMITSLAKTAASAYTGGAIPAGGGISGGGGSSQQGAKINYFDKTQGAGGTASGGNGGAAPSGAVGGSSGGGGSSSGGLPNGRGPNGDGGGGGYSRNPAALQALWGDTQSPSSMIERIVDKVGFGEGDPATPASAGGALATRKAWPKLDPTAVTSRIKDLSADANLFDQGALGLCTAAAFFHHILQRRGPEFQVLASSLYGSGIGFLGKMRVAPGSDLRNADYSALALKTPNMPPQADWMVMSALRDSENWFFDFEGAADESTAMSTSAKELSGWYRDTGFYTSVTFDHEAGLAEIKAIKKTPKNHIAIWIEASLLIDASKATHMITIESPLVIDEPGDKITFDYWTWGQPVKTMSAKLSTFKAAYLGVITASF